MTTTIPKPKIKRRPINGDKLNKALQEGLPSLLSQIYAARPSMDEVSPKIFLDPKLKMLSPPDSLPDIEKAAQRIIQAMNNGEQIGIETDHDCDGQTSHAVIYTVLTEHFKYPTSKISSYIGHRLIEGYGLSPLLTQRILDDPERPSLIITADNGSSDEKQIALLKAAGIDTIVTDHHEIPSTGIPQSAYACVNPIREDSDYPDRYIAGCMVAWLLMAYTRARLQEARKVNIPSMASTLDYVAVGTIADCVSMARSLNNRIVVSYGMKLIEQGLRPCWQALLPELSLPLSSDDLGFKIGPMLNSDGRLSTALGSVSFLLAKDNLEAQNWINHLREQNVIRKTIQDRITKLAIQAATTQAHANRKGLCILLEDGHAGVHGITASRVKDMFGLPVVIFSPKVDSPDLITGSARSVDGFHLKEALDTIARWEPNLMEKYGGHQGAAGLTLSRAHFVQFQNLFDLVCNQNLTAEMVGPIIWTDLELNESTFSLSEIEDLFSRLEPFGREFTAPIFEAVGVIRQVQPLGQNGRHLRINLQLSERTLQLVWFNCIHEGAEVPVSVGERVFVALTPRLQTFRGDRQLSCQLVHLEPYQDTAMITD